MLEQSQIIKKFFKILAVLIVFVSSLSVPMYLSYKTESDARKMRVRMDMGQLKNWAILYSIEHGDYAGIEDEPEIKRVFTDIKAMGGYAFIFASKDNKKYCCQTNFLNKELGSWCVDHTGSVGGNGKCDINNVQCK